MGAHYVAPSTTGTNASLQDLKEYFRRPRIIAAGNLTSRTNNVNRHITSATMPVYVPDFSERLVGVHGLRAKFVFTLQVAASAFHQGIVALSWQYGSSVDETFKRWREPFSATTLPHVRLDISSSTMTQLTVPYLFYKDYLHLDGSWAFGTATVTTLTNVPVPTGAVPPTYKLYLHLEDLDLIGAEPYAATSIAVQAGKRLPPLAEEAEHEGFPFSSAGFALARSVRWIARGVPSLSSIAGPASWAISKASGALRAFGFSKPQIQEPYSRMIPRVNVNEHNVDVASATNTISAFASNTLAVDPKVGATDVDEMALAYVLSQYSQVSYFNYTSSTTTGSVLYGSRVSPSYMWYRQPSALPAGNFPAPLSAGANKNAFYPSHLFYWASCFRYWRGSFKFRFTFAKTKFHGGRVMACFVPSATASTNPSDTGTLVLGPEVDSVAVQPFGYTAIFDLRDGSIFDFEVPYISPAPFVRFNEDIGSVTLTVLDPLAVSGAIPDSVGVMVEVCGASDFELSCPCGNRYPVIEKDFADGLPVIRLQSGKILSTIESSDNQLTMGECVTSVKQLAMIPKVTPFVLGQAPTSIRIKPPPWWWVPRQPASQASIYATPSRESFGLAGYVASAYTFVRGSTDYHVYGAENIPAASISAALADEEGIGVVSAGSVLQLPCSGAPRIIDRPNGHYRAPAFQKYSRLPVSVSKGASWNLEIAAGAATSAAPSYNSTNLADHSTWYHINVSAVTPTNINAYFSRAAADDAMAVAYIGPPTLYAPSVVGASPQSYDVEGRFFRT